MAASGTRPAWTLDRRRLLAAGAASALLAGTKVGITGAQDGLSGRALHRGLRYGAAVRPSMLKADAAYAAAVEAECGQVVIEGDMGWTVVQPQPSVWDFKRADAGVAWATNAGLPVPCPGGGTGRR